MFPVAIIVATIAMMFGVGGALFFSPIFIILFPIMGVPSLLPAEAIGAALITELFGFSSGLYSYYKKGLIDYATGFRLILLSLPLAIFGAIIKYQFVKQVLLFIFAIALWLMGIYVMKTSVHVDDDYFTKGKIGKLQSLTDSQGIKYEYLVCNTQQGQILTGIGGFFTGLISVGIGETVVSTLRARCGLPMKIASGTSVFVVTIVVLTASLTDVLFVGISNIPWELLIFTIPGVLIGGQVGPRFAVFIPEEKSEKMLVYIFFIIGTIMAYLAVY